MKSNYLGVMTFSAERVPLRLTVESLPSINYALVLNGGVSFSKFELINAGGNRIDNVRIVLSGKMIEDCGLTLDGIDPGMAVNFDNARLMPVSSKLMALTEAVGTTYRIDVLVDGVNVLGEVVPLTLLAFDQWSGPRFRPELLAAFVTPNNPCIPKICRRASEILKLKTGVGDLDQYFSLNSDRIVSQVESVYDALLENDIAFASTPLGLETEGQRIRLADKVIDEKLGDCLDLSLLICGCLESIGIKTSVLLYHTHAVAGVWLTPSCQVPVSESNPEEILGIVRDNRENFLMIESTALTRGETFGQAVISAKEWFETRFGELECFVDISEARKCRVRPLPHTVRTSTGWVVKDMPDYDVLFDELAKVSAYDIKGVSSSEKLKNKQLVWERKLLDLTLRNSLVNMRPGKSVIPLVNLTPEVALSTLKTEDIPESVLGKENADALKALYRSSRTALEESGANSLFLSLGTMRWYETDENKPYFAPVVLIPVELVRHGAKKYILRGRDEDPMVNMTLVEMMRQTFELEIPPLYPMLMDEDDSPDYNRVFDILRTAFAEINEKRPKQSQWSVVEECVLGLFSFTKFVMWNDVHTNREVIAGHPLLKSMVEGRLLLDQEDDGRSARELDHSLRPADLCVPIDVDSAQLEAVVASDKGQSFILYGPPGTGKSQTITNMIANALYKGKRVLFVSEKKAALEVVQERLDKIGLSPFCLELHSNKVNKKSFLEQLKGSLGVTLDEPSASYYNDRSDALFASRNELNGYMEALHRKREGGLSLYEYINAYLAVEGVEDDLSSSALCAYSPDYIKDYCDRLRRFDTIAEIVGCHPGSHPLRGLYPKTNTLKNQSDVEALLGKLPEAVRKARKKEAGIINRLFLKRSELEILRNGDVWRDLMAVADIDGEIADDTDALLSADESWLAARDRLKKWYHFSLAWLEMGRKDVGSAKSYYMAGHSGEATAAALMKGYYKSMIMSIVDSDACLRGFNKTLFDESVEMYRQKAREFQNLTRLNLTQTLSMRSPYVVDLSPEEEAELATLKKRIATNGRRATIRQMIEDSPNIIGRLCPCMLMSPLSVAQYLRMVPGQFDLVIFDEASQMPTSEAVGAIARGKATIVAGDPRQMPPTSFFMTKNVVEDDVDIDDLESVLDDCIALGVPGKYLSLHYRSRHESLIAFSNRHFYDDKLVTFPSSNDMEAKVSLQLVDGCYDSGKGRCNKVEAKAIVEETLSLLRKRLDDVDGQWTRANGKSIGIIAFSIAQSSLIEDMLTDALAKNPDLEQIAMKGEEPVFVKNLENVQGDERDIILFSVGYGPDKKGRVSMNFGPLNQNGGERRLNVAISRARYCMKVFSTMSSSQIDLQRTGANGVLALKRFLEYAETGVLPRRASLEKSAEVSEICRKVCERIQEKGFDARPDVGRSSFKLDVAVVDKSDADSYCLGILIDGDNQYAVPTARDREIVRPSVLANLGWRIVRLSTQDWIENGSARLDKVLDELSSAADTVIRSVGDNRINN